MVKCCLQQMEWFDSTLHIMWQQSLLNSWLVYTQNMHNLHCCAYVQHDVFNIHRHLYPSNSNRDTILWNLGMKGSHVHTTQWLSITTFFTSGISWNMPFEPPSLWLWFTLCFITRCCTLGFPTAIGIILLILCLSPPIPAISLYFVFREWLCEHDAQRVLLPEKYTSPVFNEWHKCLLFSIVAWFPVQITINRHRLHNLCRYETL